MDSLWQILEKPFTALRLEQQILAALVIFCCAAITVCAVAFASGIGTHCHFGVKSGIFRKCE